METHVFTTLLDQLKQLKLSKDKFYFLKNAASSYYFFNGEQLCQICLCFPHSTDKKDAVQFLERRIAADISAETAAQIIRSASFSRDRLGILQILVGHVNGLKEQQEQKVVVSAFDFFIDKDQAWDILAKQCEAFGASMPALTAAPEPDAEMADQTPIPAPLLQKMVHDEAVGRSSGNIETATKLTIFDLPIMKEMSFLRNEFPSMEQAVFEEVQKRRQAGHTFVIPSRIMSITANLKPGRRLTIGDEPTSRNTGGLPDVVPSVPQVTDITDILEERTSSNDNEIAMKEGAGSPLHEEETSIKEAASVHTVTDDPGPSSNVVGGDAAPPDLVSENGSSGVGEKDDLGDGEDTSEEISLSSSPVLKPTRIRGIQIAEVEHKSLTKPGEVVIQTIPARGLQLTGAMTEHQDQTETYVNSIKHVTQNSQSEASVSAPPDDLIQSPTLKSDHVVTQVIQSSSMSHLDQSSPFKQEEFKLATSSEDRNNYDHQSKIDTPSKNIKSNADNFINSKQEREEGKEEEEQQQQRDDTVKTSRNEKLSPPSEHRLVRSSSDRDRSYHRRNGRPYRLQYDIFNLKPDADDPSLPTGKPVYPLLSSDTPTKRRYEDKSDSLGNLSGIMTTQNDDKDRRKDYNFKPPLDHRETVSAKTANDDVVTIREKTDVISDGGKDETEPESPMTETWETWEETIPVSKLPPIAPKKSVKNVCVHVNTSPKPTESVVTVSHKSIPTTPHISSPLTSPRYVAYPHRFSLTERSGSEPPRPTITTLPVINANIVQNFVRPQNTEHQQEQSQLQEPPLQPEEQIQLQQEQILLQQQLIQEQQQQIQLQHKQLIQQQQKQQQQQQQQDQQQNQQQSPTPVVDGRPPASQLFDYRLEARRSWLDARLQRYRKATALDNERPSSAADLTTIGSSRPLGRPPPPSAGRNSSRRATAEIFDARQSEGSTPADPHERVGGRYDVLIGLNRQLSSSTVDSSAEDLNRSTTSTPRRRVTADLFVTSQPETPSSVNVSNGGVAHQFDDIPARPNSAASGLVGLGSRLPGTPPSSQIRDISRSQISFMAPPPSSLADKTGQNNGHTPLITDFADSVGRMPMTGYKVRYRARFSKPSTRPMSLESRDGRHKLSFGNYYRPGLYHYAS